MLLTKTTELAVQCMLYLAGKPAGHRANPAEISEVLGESPSYLSKVLRLLARAGLLRSYRGQSGGFGLARAPLEVSLLHIVEACQGLVPGNYCEEITQTRKRNTCGYHQAMVELQDGVCDTLRRWNLKRILDAPPPSKGTAPHCKLQSTF